MGIMDAIHAKKSGAQEAPKPMTVLEQLQAISGEHEARKAEVDGLIAALQDPKVADTVERMMKFVRSMQPAQRYPGPQ